MRNSYWNHLLLLLFLTHHSTTSVSGFTRLVAVVTGRVDLHGRPLLHSTNVRVVGEPPLEVGEKLLWLSQVEDDDDRRREFEMFIVTRIGGEKQQQRQQPWNRRTSQFVRDVEERLTFLGNAVQDDAWQKYVMSGFRSPRTKKSQLWACVDMTVQFQRVVRKFDLPK